MNLIPHKYKEYNIYIADLLLLFIKDLDIYLFSLHTLCS